MIFGPLNEWNFFIDTAKRRIYREFNNNSHFFQSEFLLLISWFNSLRKFLLSQYLFWIVFVPGLFDSFQDFSEKNQENSYFDCICLERDSDVFSYSVDSTRIFAEIQKNRSLSWWKKTTFTCAQILIQINVAEKKNCNYPKKCIDYPWRIEFHRN